MSSGLLPLQGTIAKLCMSADWTMCSDQQHAMLLGSLSFAPSRPMLLPLTPL